MDLNKQDRANAMDEGVAEEDRGENVVWWKRVLSMVMKFAWIVVLGGALYALQREWGGFHYSKLTDAIRMIGWGKIAIALVLTAMSLLCNASLDLLALKWMGKKIPTWKALSMALIAGSFSMNGGGTILGGGTMRMRLYGQYGMDGADVAKITGFLLAAGWLGHALLAGVLMCWSPPVLPWFSIEVGRMLGAVLLISCVLMGVLSARGFKKNGKEILPPLKMFLAMTGVATMDWLLAGLALRIYLPPEIHTLPFLASTAVGQALGAASQVPGGVGVMELSVSALSSGLAGPQERAAALLMYRLTYYLIPFLIAIIALSLREIWVNRHIAKATVDGSAKVLSVVAPRLAVMSALAGGFVLMLSAGTPMVEERRLVLENFIPLPFVEASNFLSSIAGTVMIVVAHGLLRRVRAAWWIAVFMAGGGIVFSLLKGFDWEEALILLVFLSALLPFKSKFPRHATIWTRRFTPLWWALILAIAGVSLWFGFHASRHVGYESDLWWQYSFDNDASRLLRGVAGSAFIFIFVGLAQWLRPAPPQRKVVMPERAKLREMVMKSPRCGSALALVGDKYFCFNYNESAFLMYRDHGRTRVAMADPVGDEEVFEGLYWRFAEQSQDEGMRCVFYQVPANLVPTCVEMGMRVYKLGEEAMIPLEKFDLGKSPYKRFRKVMNRMEREKWKFEIWEPEVVRERLEELRAVSDAWLSHLQAREKGFSLGCFEDEYVCSFPVAVILIEGKVIAFGNLWPGDGKTELSTDLMRHVPNAPNGVMDCLFVSLMLWGREQGYRWFDLGMAPLSGLDGRQMAPLWHRIGGLIYNRGGAFYNFHGLRAWKSKFDPVWRPRYLAIPKAWDLPAVMIDITGLIGKSSMVEHGKDEA